MRVKPVSNSLADPFARALREAVGRIGADGRLRTSDARTLRRAIRNRPATDRSALLDNPDIGLGPFGALSFDAQKAVVEALTKDERWRMAGQNKAVWRARLTRRLWRARATLPRRLGRRPREAAEMLAVALKWGPGALHAIYRRALASRAKFARRPKLPTVLAAAGVEVRNLAVRYARGMPQLPSYRGFWYDPARHTTVGLIVGLDLIKNSEGYWLVETNMNCGLHPSRTALYQEDPFVRSVLDFAAANSYRRLIVLSGTSSVEPAMARQFRQGAADRKIAVTLLEDAFRPLYGYERAISVPELEHSEALLVRNRHYPTNLDYVVNHKRASSRALRIYKEESGDSIFQLPVTSNEPCVLPADPSDPFPNVVFKFPERDAGEGVVFLKVASASQAIEVLNETLSVPSSERALRRLYFRLSDRQGLYQTYVRTPWLTDRRLYKTRAYVLLTPVGVHFLSAHRIVGPTPVPKELAMGVVRDQSPYLVNYRPGATLEVMPPEELPAVRAAALGVARGLSDAILFGFQTGPSGSETGEGVAETSSRAARPYESVTR